MPRFQALHNKRPERSEDNADQDSKSCIKPEPRSTDIGNAVQPPNTFTPSELYKFVDRHGREHFDTALVSPDQRAELDTLIMTQFRLRAAWGRLKSELWDSFSSVTGLSWWDLHNAGHRRLRRLAKQVVGGGALLSAFDALEEPATYLIVHGVTTIREKRSGGLTFTFSTWEMSRTFNFGELAIASDRGEASLRSAHSALSELGTR